MIDGRTEWGVYKLSLFAIPPNGVQMFVNLPLATADKLLEFQMPLLPAVDGASQPIVVLLDGPIMPSNSN